MDTDKAAIVEGTPSDAIALPLVTLLRRNAAIVNIRLSLGQKVYTDTRQKGVSRAQRGIGLNGILALLFFILVNILTVRFY